MQINDIGCLTIDHLMNYMRFGIHSIQLKLNMGKLMSKLTWNENDFKQEETQFHSAGPRTTVISREPILH